MGWFDKKAELSAKIQGDFKACVTGDSCKMPAAEFANTANQILSMSQTAGATGMVKELANSAQEKVASASRIVGSDNRSAVFEGGKFKLEGP